MPRGLEPHIWFAERLLLTLSGQRPVYWMLGHSDDRAYERLIELATRAPLRGGNRPVVDACRASDPAPDVIEAYARIAYGEHRHRALAFRLERAPDGRWRCTAVDVGPA